MTRRGTRKRKLRPDPPLGPRDFDTAPAEVEQGAVWDCVTTNGDLVIPEHVADWKIQESRLVGVDLSVRSFGALRCRDTHFVRCDLSGATLDGATLERVAFSECRLSGTVLSGAQLVDVLIDTSRADLLNLRMARATNLLVENSMLRGADLTSFSANDCAFLRSHLRDAILHDAQLAGTRLHGSELENIRGALALRSCLISADQQVAIGAVILATLDIRVTDEPS